MPRVCVIACFCRYAEYLALNDKFDEAQQAYRDAGLPQLSLKMLGQLTHNAVTENRFKDAAFYFWLLAQENIKMIPDDITSKRKFNKKQVKAYRQHRLYAQRARQYVVSILRDCVLGVVVVVVVVGDGEV